MNYKVENTQRFAKELKRLIKKYPSLRSEYIALVSSLEDNPIQGKTIGNGFYKIRIGIASKANGKRGGARVITYVKVLNAVVYLATIYDKSEKEDIGEKEINSLLKTIFN